MSKPPVAPYSTVDLTHLGLYHPLRICIEMHSTWWMSHLCKLLGMVGAHYKQTLQRHYSQYHKQREGFSSAMCPSRIHSFTTYISITPFYGIISPSALVHHLHPSHLLSNELYILSLGTIQVLCIVSQNRKQNWSECLVLISVFN